ncbi:metallophosphoesterase [Ornithinibacillus sp. 4-3]|uniref:Metallophosphoesterase n=1 Tax=Ornithinibacillus sp. 4-3 TaxID=3231488 RepID=A0AB39HVJ2_9BACI
MNRRSFLKKMLGAFIATVGVTTGGYYYASELETNMLQINKQTIDSKKIPPSFQYFKIVQFSDTHVGFHYSLEQLSDLVETINKQNPDMIVFTGDLIDEPQTYKNHDQLIQILKQLKAPYGKYWVYGNHDHGGYGTNIIHDLMEAADFQLLLNEHQVIEKGKDKIIVAGIDDAILGVPDVKNAMQDTQADNFIMLLAHEPDMADVAIDYPIDIQLSGHSHGGQVRLPFIGHLYTPSYAQNYIHGKYTFSPSDFILHVNRGIGTTRLPFRFFCKPELHVYSLVNHSMLS